MYSLEVSFTFFVNFKLIRAGRKSRWALLVNVQELERASSLQLIVGVKVMALATELGLINNCTPSVCMAYGLFQYTLRSVLACRCGTKARFCPVTVNVYRLVLPLKSVSTYSIW